MATAGSISAGKGHVTLGVDTSPLEKGLQAAKSKVESFGKTIATIGAGIAAAGAAITAPFAAGLAMLADTASEIGGASRATGMSITEVQSLMAGLRLSADDLQGATKDMSKFLVEVSGGSEDARKTLRDLGLSFSELQGMSQHDRMMTLADAISKVGDAALRSTYLNKIFGREGLKANVSGGRAGIQGRSDRAAQISPFITPADEKAAKDYSAAQKELAAATKGIFLTLGAVAAPTMTKIARLVVDVVVAIQQWVRANRPLLDVVFKVGLGLVAIGSTIASVGGAIVGGGALIGMLTTAFAAAIPIVLVVGKVLLVVGAVLAVIGLVVGAVALAIYALGFTFSDVAIWLQAAWSGVVAYFQSFMPVINEVWSLVMTAWEGISNALSAGEFALAGKIAWAALKVAWIEAVGFIWVKWLEFVANFGQAFDGVRNTVVSVMVAIVRAVGNGISGIVNVVQERVNSLIDAIPEWIRNQAGLQRLNVNVGGAVEGVVAGIEAVGRPGANADAQRQAAIQAARDQVGLAAQGARGELKALTDEAAVKKKIKDIEAAKLQSEDVGPPGSLPGKGGKSSAGTFDAAALAFMSGGTDPMTMVERNTRDQINLLNQIRDHLQNMGFLRFE